MKALWTLRDLVDFEALMGRDVRSSESHEKLVRASVRGLSGAEARRVGMKVWLDSVRKVEKNLAGDFWASGRFIVGALICCLMFLGGIAVMAGLLDRERMGFHVPMVLGVTVGFQLLFLLFTGILVLFRGKMSGLQRFTGWLIGKIAKKANFDWWHALKLEGGRGWVALGWNLIRLSQAGAVMFSVGLMAGLLRSIWFQEVSFYWESTTPEWMAERLREVCVFLSAPWSWAFPSWVPGMEAIEKSRWSVDGGWAGVEFAGVWYRFLFAAIFTWGLLPRLGLWFFATWQERRALAGLDFQGKRHREIWRDIMGTRRVDVSAKPMDGVLVLDVGGTGLTQEQMRGFLLRNLRVNPNEWYQVGVWDEQGEEAAAMSLHNAPAGVVLLAEGWALSPPKMMALYQQIRATAGTDTMIYFLVVNCDENNEPVEVAGEEEKIWSAFVDGLTDASAEVFFYKKEDL